MLAFGSHGVPIKGRAAKSVAIDPFVFQSYKTLVCFITCWFVLLLIPSDEQVQPRGLVDRLWSSFEFTPWGILSGLFWVPG